MSAAGYGAARLKTEATARALRDMALLVGEPAAQSVALETGGELVPGLGFREDAAALAARARDLSQGLFKIIVLGEFKNGKSTLLNGMLGSKTLPAKAAPATAIITVLVHGGNPQVAIYESGRDEPRLVSWEAFVEEFQLSRQDQETLQERGTVDRFRHVEYAQVECLHPICANGVKLIDSPGLGEHISRTRVATNFLKQSQAVIFVLNATRILGQEERDFIDSVLGQGRLNHVFFVVNRINQVDERDVPDIRSWVENGLRPHFLDEIGSFDQDFYQRRVFFVDAKGALDARRGVGAPGDGGPRAYARRPYGGSTPSGTWPVDQAQLEASGVPALERELERFLTTDEKVAAALQSTVQFLIPVIDQARRRVAQVKVALDQPLEELEQRREEAERRLVALEGRKSEIERTILLFAETVKQKTYTDLRAYVDQMRETWPDDSRRLIDLDQAISIKNVLASYAQRQAREDMVKAIGEQVQRYLQIKFGEWSDRIPGLIQRDVDQMVAEVEAQVEDFQLELEQIACLFAGTPSSPGAARQGTEGARLVHLALSLGDISSMTDAALGTGDWTRVIGRMVQQAIVVLIVGFIVGNFLIALVIVQAIHLGMHENEIKKRIRESLGERLHENLLEQVAEKQAFIYDSIQQRFRQFAGNLTGVIQNQLDDVRAEQERILRQKQDEHFSVEREKHRLDSIAEKLGDLFGHLSEEAYAKRPDQQGA